MSTLTEVFDAIREGNLDRVQEGGIGIEGGIGVNECNSSGTTMLAFAARLGETAIAAYLLEKKADVNLCNSKGNTALLEALASRRGEALIELLVVTAKADVNLSNNKGYTPLHYAVSSIPLIKDKFPYFMTETEMNTSNFAEDNIKIINMLLSKGANANAVNTERHTPLVNMWKVNRHKTEILEAVDEVAKVLIQAMLLQNLEAEKPKFFRHKKELSSYWDQCKIEILSLKEITFAGITLLDFFNIKDIDSTENLNKLELMYRMSSNEKIEEIINESNFIKKHPIFGGKIKENFEQGLARNKHLTMALNLLVHNNENAKLNEYCSLKVLKYLDKESLKRAASAASLFFRSTPSDNKRSDIAQTNDFLLKP